MRTGSGRTPPSGRLRRLPAAEAHQPLYLKQAGKSLGPVQLLDKHRAVFNQVLIHPYLKRQNVQNNSQSMKRSLFTKYIAFRISLGGKYLIKTNQNIRSTYYTYFRFSVLRWQISPKLNH